MLDLQSFKGFTAGPWRVESNTTLVWGACNPDDNTSYGMGYPVADAQQPRPWTRNKPTDEQIDANAALIAAAPDLLDLAIKQADRIAKLEAALKPFSDVFDDLPDEYKDHWSLWESPAAMSLSARDIVNARVALEPSHA